MRVLKIFICVTLILTFTIPVLAEDSIYVWSPAEKTSSKSNTTTDATTTNSNTTTNTSTTKNNTTATNVTSTTSNVTNTIETSEFEDSENYSVTTNSEAIEEETNSTTEDSSSNTGENTLALESGSAILIEQSTGQVLYAHNIHEQLRPASVTKVMSILLIMEALDSGKISLTDTVPCSENAASMGGSQIWLDPRETLTVDEMLKAICVASANDCVVAMAEYIAGSQEAFVQMMNDKAQELGMKDTTFKNCHGLDEDGHVTSSYDIALMSRELLKNHPDITKYTTIWTDSLRDRKVTISKHQ